MACFLGHESNVFLQTPAWPASILLYGLLFALAAAHFLVLPKPRAITILVYLIPFVWIVLIAHYRAEKLKGFGRIDVLFGGFIFVVLSSMLIMPEENGESARKYLGFMSFMMIALYICGRLMRGPDVALFSRISMVAGVAVLPLLLLDRFYSPGRETGRWAFFGQDHGALLAGVLLAVALIALCVYVLGGYGGRSARFNRFVLYGLIGLVTAALVWITARGWLLSGLLGVGVTSLAAWHRPSTARVGLLILVISIAALSFSALLRLDPVFNRMYSAMPLETLTIVDSDSGVAPRPILGEASCQPFRGGMSSIAIRWVLYQEAIAMFSENPLFGVGVARFGERSCAGPKTYPHSTILQGFSELGIIGGSLLVALMTVAAVTLVRRVMSNKNNRNPATDLFTLAIFVAFFMVDQTNGNYFMSVGIWLILGLAAGMEAEDRYKDHL